MDINIIIAVFVGMVLCHLLADFPLQGWLAQAKRKAFWANSDERNRCDWVAALACHATMWAIMVMIPIAIASKFELGAFWIALPANILLHFVIDFLKANTTASNLIRDQLAHLIQILGTWGIWANVYCHNLLIQNIALWSEWSIVVAIIIVDAILTIVSHMRKTKSKEVVDRVLYITLKEMLKRKLINDLITKEEYDQKVEALRLAYEEGNLKEMEAIVHGKHKKES